MKKLVYTVQGFEREEQQELLTSLLPEILRAYGSDGNVRADVASASVTFGVARKTAIKELEQRINAALEAHGMQLLTPSGVRYYAYQGPKSKKRTVPVSALVASLIAAVSLTLVITMLLTAVISTAYWKDKHVDSVTDDQASSETEGLLTHDETLMLIDRIIRDHAYDGVDPEKLMEAVVDAYVAATGDVYAEYYNKEEYALSNSQRQGNMQGIGVSVDTATWEGATAIKIMMVYPNSPAEKADLKSGDLIVAMQYNGEMQTIDAIGGYTMALNLMRGESGTHAEFRVMRFDGEGYEQIDFSIKREAFETVSVLGRVSESDPTVGIVNIVQFMLPTPEQFEAEVDALLAKGCTKFVFDMRNNPGGDLAAARAILSYFLQQGDLIMTTENNSGYIRRDVVDVITYAGDYSVCDVTEDEIGKYKDLTFCVLTNANTASAAELFTATMRDYGLGVIIGEVTYGKACIQNIFNLSTMGPDYGLYGVEGALKLTTQMLFPASGVCYHGVGITPHIEISIPAEVLERYTIYNMPEELDTQLQAALEQMK